MLRSDLRVHTIGFDSCFGESMRVRGEMSRNLELRNTAENIHIFVKWGLSGSFGDPAWPEGWLQL